jgi:IclR family transcriptional regulator, mhp operon transcriptional activator
MSNCRPVQSVARAIEVLKVLNQHNNSGLSELFAVTGVPKPSLIRTLETLMAEGYVEQDVHTGAYRISCSTAGLSEGFHGAPLLAEAGRELCISLTRDLKWPVSIAVLEGTAMFAFFSTVPDSPVAPYRPMFKKPRGLLDSALGRAYLAFCPDEERKVLARMLKHVLSVPPDVIDAQIDEIVRKARHHGFASRDASGSPLKNATIAIPLRFDDRILGTLGITYFGSAIRRAEILEKVVTPLRDTAQRIEANIKLIKCENRSHTAPETGSKFQQAPVRIAAEKKAELLFQEAKRSPLMSKSRLLRGQVELKLPIPEELRALPRSVADVILALEADIVRRRIVPGARLVEDTLMLTYQAKRHSVRAALEELERLGAVEKPRGRGATLRQLSMAELVALFETVGLLQCAAVERLMPPNPQQLANIKYWLAQFNEAAAVKHTPALHRTNMMFHDAIYSLCGNSFLTKTIRSFDWMMFSVSAFSLGVNDVLAQECAEHAEMLTLLGSNNFSELRELVLAHSSASRKLHQRQYFADTAADVFGSSDEFVPKSAALDVYKASKGVPENYDRFTKVVLKAIDQPVAGGGGQRRRSRRGYLRV